MDDTANSFDFEPPPQFDELSAEAVDDDFLDKYQAEPPPIPPDELEDEADDEDEDEVAAAPPPPPADYSAPLPVLPSASEPEPVRVVEPEHVEPVAISPTPEVAAAAAAVLRESFGLPTAAKQKKKKKRSRRAAPVPVVASGDSPAPVALPVDTPLLLPAGGPASTGRIESPEAAGDVSTLEPERNPDLTSPNDYLATHTATFHLSPPPQTTFTTISASNNYIAFGTSTGSTHVYAKDTARCVQVLLCPTGGGTVTTVAFARNERLLAFGTSEGSVFIWAGVWGAGRTPGKCVKAIRDHEGHSISAVTWTPDSKAVLTGDTSGLVITSPVATSGISSGASSMFTKMKTLQKIVDTVLPQSEVVFRCKSAVTQIDVDHAGFAALSCETRVYMANTKQRKVIAVGDRLREGEFGACLGTDATGLRRVFCARPGARIWLGDVCNGKVISMLNMKSQFDRPSTPMITMDLMPAEPSPSEGPMGWHFKRLLLCRDRYLVSWNPSKLFVIDLVKERLGGWYHLDSIVDVDVHGDQIYVLQQNGFARDQARRSPGTAIPELEYVASVVALQTPAEAMASMVSAGQAVAAAEMVLEYSDAAGADKLLGAGSELARLRHELAERGGTPGSSLEPRICTLAKTIATLAAEQENERNATIQHSLQSVAR